MGEVRTETIDRILQNPTKSEDVSSEMKLLRMLPFSRHHEQEFTRRTRIDVSRHRRDISDSDRSTT